MFNLLSQLLTVWWAATTTSYQLRHKEMLFRNFYPLFQQSIAMFEAR